MQANSEKHEADRWEAFLDTVFVRSKKIKEIRASVDTVGVMFNYMQKAGYTGLAAGLMGNPPPHLWDVPIVIDNACHSPKIIYHEGALSPEPQPKPKKEKPVDTWQDDEV